MGWTGISKYYCELNKKGKIDRKATLDYEFRGWTSETCGTTTNIKSAMVGTTYYAAFKTEKPNGAIEVWAMVIITSLDKNEFRYKDMTEDMMPGYFDCPKSILDLLTPTDDEYANKWRQNCREALANRNKKTWLQKLNIGDKIIYTKRNGEQLTLVKHAPAYQLKTWFWYDEANNCYVPKKRVTTDNSATFAENPQAKQFTMFDYKEVA